MAEKSRERGYKWQKLRKRVIARDLAAHGKLTCHLCRRDIDQKAEGAWKLEIDHIIPRSEAPHLEMVITNLATACRVCNRLRGNRSVDECVGTDLRHQQWVIITAANANSWEARQEAKALGDGKPAATIRARVTSEPTVQRLYRRGVDYGPFCPLTGKERPETSRVRPHFNPAFFPVDERPYDENTGQRRPGVEHPIGSGDFGL